jgi:hypothetical protein
MEKNLSEFEKYFEASAQDNAATVVTMMKRTHTQEVKAAKKALDLVIEKVVKNKEERDERVHEAFQKRITTLEATFVRQYVEASRR